VLSDNQFYKAKQQFIVRRYKEYLSVYRIQQWWNKVITTPIYAVCLRKIKRDYEKCTGRLFC